MSLTAMCRVRINLESNIVNIITKIYIIVCDVTTVKLCWDFNISLVSIAFKPRIHCVSSNTQTPHFSQAFNVPQEVGISEWLSGRLELPEGAIKDSEHVSYSTQLYIVGEGQPNALELAIAMPSSKVSISPRQKEFDHHG